MGNERSKGRDNRLNGAFRDCIGAGNELKFKRHTRLTTKPPIFDAPLLEGAIVPYPALSSA